MDENRRAGLNDPQKVEQIRNAQGKLLGYKTTKPNALGITQAWDSKGKSLGWSKDAASGGLPYTMRFGKGRVSNSESPDMLFWLDD